MHTDKHTCATRRWTILAGILFGGGFLTFGSGVLSVVGESTESAFDGWLYHATRYGNTPARRSRKHEAREAIFARGPDALDALMNRTGIKNTSIRILAEHMVGRLEPDEGAPVLISFLASTNATTRKLAVYFLSFYDVPEYADRVRPLLADGEADAAAIRTLGKWKDREALLGILPFLRDPDERHRVVAVNALRDIGDPRAVPYLVQSLDDQVFTVRNSAERALVSFGPPAAAALLVALPDAEPPALRQMIRALGQLAPDGAVEPLRGLLCHDDWGVRGEAVRALRLVAPDDAGLAEAILDDPEPFVRGQGN